LRLVTTVLLLALASAPASAAPAVDVWTDPRHVDFTSALRFGADHPLLSSILIADRDSVLAEGYWRGGGADRVENVKSVSKSVLAALVGIALDRGDLPPLDTPVARWFPEHSDLLEDDPRARITLEDLLTMRSGLETTSFYNYGAWVAGSDWVRGQLRMPVEFEPGTTMRYSTGASHLVSVILERATGVRPSVYAARHLFGPIGVQGVHWDRDPQGHDFGGNNLSMTPRQMLRFGRLHLARGEYDGRRVLPTGWVERAWRPRTRSHWNGFGYGYFWWYRRIAGTPVHYAWGHGGQRIFVLPEPGLVVVTTADLGPGGRGRMTRTLDELLVRHVLGAIRRPATP
jgi:CubicO group peptidase (beta-lactamase class C family)